MTPCLDDQPTRDANGKPLPAVTGKHYNYAQRKNMEAKRKVLDRWAAEPRRSSARPPGNRGQGLGGRRPLDGLLALEIRKFALAVEFHAISLASCGRSARTPLIFYRYIVATPAAFRPRPVSC